MTAGRPPRLSRWLLARLVPSAEREFVLGDLAEEYAERAATDRRAANGWYRRQVGRAIFERSARRGTEEPDARATERRFPASRRAAGETWEDLRFGARSLAGAKALSLVAIVTLALGVGVTTAIFTLIDAILVQPLPFAGVDRLVVLRHHYLDGGPGEWNSSFPAFLEYEAATSSFEVLAAWNETNPALGADDGGPAIRVRATGVTWNFLDMLGVEPELGRGFRPEEDARGAGTPVAVLSHGLWQSRFGGDRGVLGRQVHLDSRAHTVVGVLPRSFTGAVGGAVLPQGPTDVWLPYRNSEAADGMEEPGLRVVSIVGKLAAGINLEQAQQDVSAVAASLAERYPDIFAGEGAMLRRAHDAVVGWVRPILWILFGAVGLVLLIACANVANLLLGRASVRRRELAVRMALGAGRGRVVRQMLVESALLGALSGAAAAAVAAALVEATRALMGSSLPRTDAVALGGNALAFAAMVSVVAGTCLGVLPALHASRRAALSPLRPGDRGGTSGRAGALLRQTLVVAQIAMSVVLLFGAGLLLRSFERALRVDPGFDPEGVLTAYVRLPMPFVDRENWPRAVTFFDDAIERLEALPGVDAAAAAFQLPTDGGWGNAFSFVGRSETPGIESPYAIFRPVTPGYFELAGIELLRGRTFTEADHADAPRVVVVNQAFVDFFFDDDEDPIGTRLDYGNWWADGPSAYEIVGVVADVRFQGRTLGGFRATYFPHAQQPVREMSLLVRTAVPPLQLAGPLRDEIAAMDPQQPVDNVSTLASHLAHDEVVRRGVAALSGLFAASALLLAAIGVYGVMSVAVAQRVRELGIRMALGARSGAVRRMVLGRGAALAAIGGLLGLAGSAGMSRYIQGLLFDTAPTDPVNLAMVVGFLAVVALVACWLPARRATRVDPMISLRAE